MNSKKLHWEIKIGRTVEYIRPRYIWPEISTQKIVAGDQLLYPKRNLLERKLLFIEQIK